MTFIPTNMPFTIKVNAAGGWAGSKKMVTGNYKDNYNLISPLLDQNNNLQKGAL